MLLTDKYTQLFEALILIIKPYSLRFAGAMEDDYCDLSSGLNNQNLNLLSSF
jgi:hypothetical protein